MHLFGYVFTFCSQCHHFLVVELLSSEWWMIKLEIWPGSSFGGLLTQDIWCDRFIINKINEQWIVVIWLRFESFQIEPILPTPNGGLKWPDMACKEKIYLLNRTNLNIHEDFDNNLSIESIESNKQLITNWQSTMRWFWPHQIG